MNYPRMLFPNGDPSKDYRIVADEDEERGAIKEGYAVAYEGAVKPDRPIEQKPTATLPPDSKKKPGRPAKAK